MNTSQKTHPSVVLWRFHSTGTKTLQLKRARLTILNLLIVLCSTFAMTAGFSQVLTWTNPVATVYQGGNFGRSTNWSGDNGAGAQTPVSGTIETFNGTVPGTIYVFSVDGINGAGSGNPIGGGFGAVGYTLNMTATQTSPVNFFCSTGATASAGMGLNSLQVDAGAGQLVLGDNSTRQIIATLRPASSLHPWINNSATPVVMYPNFQLQNGGGAGGHVIDFQGTGNWNITNALRFNNNAPSQNIQWDSTGSTIWASTGESGASGTNLFNSALGNIIINAGTITVVSAGLFPITPGANTIQHNGTLLNLAQTGQSDTIGRTISGISPIQISGGTNSFTSGNSTFSGNINLTGGELNAGAPENTGISGPLGQGGTISFNGGTLGYSPNNAADYSARFDTSAGQAYRIDTANQSVTYGTGLVGTGSSLTKLGGGTLTLAGANSYTGPTTISVGELIFQGTKSGSGNITLANGAAMGVFEAGAQITPGTLTLGSGADITTEFNNVTNKLASAVAASTLSSGGTVNINVNSGRFILIGDTFPLFSWGSGATPATLLGVVGGATGHLTTNGNSINLVIDVPPFIWTGANNGSWDTTTPNNWVFSAVPVTWTNGSIALIDDSATGATNLTITGTVLPQSITVNNTTNAYSITNSSGNVIGGTASLTKIGNNTLTMVGGANTYTGVTTVGAGTLIAGTLANGLSPSDIGAASSASANIVLNGGSLQYIGAGATIDRGFSVGTLSGAIDNEGTGPLVLNNTGNIGLKGSGPRTLTLAGADTGANTLAANVVDSSGGSTGLSKNGPSLWVLTGNNTYSGVTTILGGLVQVGTGGATGSLGTGNVVNNGVITFNRTGSVTVNGAISGTGTVTNNGSGTVILAGNNSYQGGTMINAGTLQVGNGGGSGSLYVNGPIHNNSLLIFNSTGSSVYTGTGLIDGSGNVVVTGSGNLVKAIGLNAYTGWTRIDAGATFQPCEGNQGQLLSSVVTNNGTLKFVRQDLGVFGYSNNIVGTGRVLKDANNNNLSDATLAGTNSYSGGTVIACGSIVLGDGVTPVAGTIVGNVVFTNSPTSQDVTRQLVFNRPEDVTFTGSITGPGGTLTGGAIPNAGQVVQNTTATLTLTADNTYLGGTIINAGTIQAGIGGATGAIGTGPVVNNGLLIFNRTANMTFPGAISGGGALVKTAPNTLTLSSVAQTYTGSTTISNGTLAYGGNIGAGGTNNMGSDLNLEGGTIIAGSISVASTLNVGGNMNIDSGTVVASLDKSLSPSPSNTTYTVGLSITHTGGSLKVLNAGPLPVPGDKFTIFNQAVPTGGSIPITSPGMTLQNDLGTDGSVTVLTVQPAPVITAALSGTTLNLSWPATWTGGVHLQAQTNALNRGVSGNWVTIAGTDASNTFSTPLNKGTNVSVFYRLVMP